MSRRFARSLACLAAATALAVAGCAKGPPPVTEVSGVVTLDGQPLPKARVEFVPDLSGFGAEMNSSAITDEQGRYTLAFTYTQQPGAVVGKHHVLVTEAPTPGEYRSMDPQTQAKLTQYMKSLKNRPIPPVYGEINKTPLIIEVKPDQKTYDLTLKRNP